MAYSFGARDEAVAAAALAGVAADKIGRNHDTGMWGWQDAAAVAPAYAGTKAGQARFRVELADMLSQSDAQALIFQLANKLGLSVTMVDVDTSEAVTANPGDKPAKAGKILVPDDVQRQIIELCTRDGGSNPWELYETVQPKQPRPWEVMVKKICADFGYTLDKGLTRYGKKACDSYTLHAVGAMAQAA